MVNNWPSIDRVALTDLIKKGFKKNLIAILISEVYLIKDNVCCYKGMALFYNRLARYIPPLKACTSIVNRLSCQYNRSSHFTDQAISVANLYLESSDYSPNECLVDSV